MNSANVYVSGAGGMLGEAFYRCFSPKCTAKFTDIDVNDKWLSHCDVRDLKPYEADVNGFSADVLIHLAALTDLEYCETHPDEAYMTNAISVENAVLIANKRNIPLVYISTAGIFDGMKDRYDDWDVPAPLGAYARSKYAGEVYVVQHCRQYLVCRAGWMMGGGLQKDKKFVVKLVRQIMAGEKTLRVVNDKLGSPTYTHDFAANVWLLLEHGLWGVYNLACEGATSRIAVALAICGRFSPHGEVHVEEVDSSFFATTYFAPRPRCECLVNRKLKLRGLNRMRPWSQALNEYLDTLLVEAGGRQ